MEFLVKRGQDKVPEGVDQQDAPQGQDLAAVVAPEGFQLQLDDLLEAPRLRDRHHQLLSLHQ